mgnify:CR=1 FL=1
MKSLFLKDELFFNEEKHEYKNKEGLRYESATQFLGHFYNHFEDQEQFWLIYKSLQYLSDIDKPIKVKKYNEELDKLIGNVIFTEREYQQYQRYGLSQCNKDDKLFLNVFSPHLLATIILKKYAPGVITAVLMILPLTFYILFSMYQFQKTSIKQLIINSLIGSFIGILLVFLFLKIGDIVT